MNTAPKWTLILAAAGLGMCMTPLSRGDATTQPSAAQAPADGQTADGQTATGNISGVVMKDGKPLANARVGLIDAGEARAHLGKRAKGGNQSNKDQSNTNADQAPSQKRQRPTPVATTMTDSDGKFSITDVKVGDYMVMAMAKREGRGRARASIVSGETATVEIDVTQRTGGGAGKAGKLSGGNKASKAGNAT
jgi:hypothetical protein